MSDKLRGQNLRTLFGLITPGEVYIHLDGDKMDQFMWRRTNRTFEIEQDWLDVNEIYISDPDSHVIKVPPITNPFYVLQRSSGSMYLFICACEVMDVTIFRELNVNLSQLFSTSIKDIWDREEFYVYFNEVFNVKKFLVPPGTYIRWYDGANILEEKHCDGKYFEMMCSNYEIKIFMAKYDHTDNQLMSKFSELYYHMPEINQIQSSAAPKFNFNWPNTVRTVLINNTPEYAVSYAFRGRQGIYIESIKKLVTLLATEYGTNRYVDITLVNDITAEQLMIMRIHLTNDLLSTQFIVGTIPSMPLYATLRIPCDFVSISNISVSSVNQYLPKSNLTDFESNVIVPNAGLALGMIGGGALSGIGQGIGAWAQAKYGLEMKNKEIDWWREKNTQDWTQRGVLQQDMFNFNKEYQGRQFKFSTDMQANQFWQERFLQNTQNNLTRELVGLESDEAIRRANNAQHLAGYRTGGAVAGLSKTTSRGGLGHPDAPKGAYLMPRSRSTQTDSPNVYRTVPTGP